MRRHVAGQPNDGLVAASAGFGRAFPISNIAAARLSQRRSLLRQCDADLPAAERILTKKQLNKKTTRRNA